MKLITVQLHVEDDRAQKIANSLLKLIDNENDISYRGFGWRPPIHWHSINIKQIIHSGETNDQPT